jgi:nicotinate-nucleotide adenylyltransferase
MMASAPLPAQESLWANRTVGILGGSFNPAHEGHRHISLEAMKRLGLDAVWWMVSPQNPLKPVKGMAPLPKRIAGAEAAARHPRIYVTDIEWHLRTRFTADTLAALKMHFPRTRFVWLMGVDNLRQIHLWHAWEKIFGLLPVAVFDRPPHGSALKSCPALEKFRSFLKPQEQAQSLKTLSPPAWTILHIPLQNVSSTAIRESKKLRKK